MTDEQGTEVVSKPTSEHSKSPLRALAATKSILSFLKPQSEGDGHESQVVKRVKVLSGGASTSDSEATSGLKCIALVDLDCFYVAVERMLDPSLNGVPVGVAQYTKSDTLIAISYEAKAAGVKRGMFGFQAKQVCPELRIVKVQVKNEKADLTRYRDASVKVLQIASRYCATIERASVDEFYLDLTEEARKRLEALRSEDKKPEWAPPTLFCTKFDTVEERNGSLRLTDQEENDHDSLLAAGTCVIHDIRQAIKNELGLDCSAGVASNRFLAKSIAGIRKPATQIALKKCYVESLCQTMPLHKARSLGGKLGEYLKDDLGIEYLGDICTQIGEAQLCQMFGDKEGKRLFQLGLGRDDTPVVPRVLPKSIGCSKTFPGVQTLLTRQQITEWLAKLCSEAVERLEKDGRRPTTLTIGSFRHGSRSTSNFNTARITNESLLAVAESLFDRLLEPNEIERRGGVTGLSLNLTGFPDPSEDDAALSKVPVAKWTCQTCTFENEGKWLRCEACGSSKSHGSAQLNVKKSTPSIASLLKNDAHNSSEDVNNANGEGNNGQLDEVAIVKAEESKPATASSGKEVSRDPHKIERKNESKPKRPPSIESFFKTTAKAPKDPSCDDDDDVVIIEDHPVKDGGFWACPTCTFAGNNVHVKTCEMCGSASSSQ